LIFPPLAVHTIEGKGDTIDADKTQKLQNAEHPANNHLTPSFYYIDNFIAVHELSKVQRVISGCNQLVKKLSNY
jgi:hypothetical protein